MCALFAYVIKSKTMFPPSPSLVTERAIEYLVHHSHSTLPLITEFWYTENCPQSFTFSCFLDFALRKEFRSSPHQCIDAISLLLESGLPMTCFSNMVKVAVGLSSIFLLVFLQSCPAAIWISLANLLEDERPCGTKMSSPCRVDFKLATSQLPWLQTQDVLMNIHENRTTRLGSIQILDQ